MAPAASKAQQQYMAAALERKREGKPKKSDPTMSEAQMEEYASTKHKDLPQKAKKGRK